MTAFGVGPQFAANCPPTPAPPTGYVVWQEHVHGPVPAAVALRAKAIAFDMSFALGYAENFPIAGVTLILRVDPHTWTTGAGGQIVAGCFHGVTVYVPAPVHHIVAPTSGQRTAMTKFVELLSLASLSASLVVGLPKFGR
jgi:hypothetical protein